MNNQPINSDTPVEFEFDRFDDYLKQRGQIAIIWSVEDVVGIRPGLDQNQALHVLDQCKRYHDASAGINWDTIASVADMLFP